MNPLIHIVDDEPMLLEMLSQFLSRTNSSWRIECFSKPTLAIEAARANNPDIIISDFSMLDISSSEELVSSSEAACSLAPSARVWLAEETCDDAAAVCSEPALRLSTTFLNGRTIP